VAPHAHAAATVKKQKKENPSRPLLQAAAVSVPATRPWVWPVLAAVAACAPFFHGLSLTKVFYVRDLATFFWPRHLWIREGLLAGNLPLWDPAAAAGQATFPDALNQLFLPPVALLRVLLPPVVAFNVIVVLPFPLAALGAWLFLRGRFEQTSATLGAVVFAASGAVVSTSNFPNLSWSIAWLPWLFWALDRDRAAGSLRSFAVLSGLIALQILSGEPVTMAGTLALLSAYVVIGDASPSSARLRSVARFAGAVVVAAIVSAVQLVPMVAAAQQSARGQMPPDNFWSLHPLWLFEAVLPHVFGHSYFGYNQQMPWLRPLNSGRDPFFYSLYVGPIVLLLSLLGTLTGKRRWSGFWLAVVVLAIVLSFGVYTPVYPLVQQIVPGVRSFRFPVKFFLFASFGLAMLVAAAADSLQARPGTRTAPAPWAVKTMIGVGLAGICGLVILVGLVIVAPYTGARFFHDLAQSVGLKDPVSGAEFMFSSVPPVASRELILLATAALLAYLGWAGQRAAGAARVLLFALTMVEVVIVNVDLNPAMPATQVGAPSWIAAMGTHPKDRFYFGGKFDGSLVPGDPDLPQGPLRPPEGFTIEEGRAVMTANLVMTPAAWGVRELLSYDLPLLWPIEHRRAEALFQTTTDRAARVRFLSRGGVRYCVVGSPMTPGAQPIQRVSEAFGSMAVYECNRDVRRAFVVANAEVIPDHTKQLARLFEESFDADSRVMLEQAAPEAVGSPGTAAPASARITRDEAQDLEIDVATPGQGGYLVLLDSFDRRWRVEVDGQPAQLLRANGLFRAVHIAPGHHTVRMHFRPTIFYASAGVSALAALMLGAVALRKPRLTDS
jgi:hypothetical protein